MSLAPSPREGVPKGSSPLVPNVTPLLWVEGLSKRYGQGTVLHQVGFALRAGERVALLGSNGAGKSTLFRCLLGLTPFEGGSIRFDGQVAPGFGNKRWRSVRKEIGFVPQHHGLVPQLCALSNVLHGRLGSPGGWRRFAQWAATQADRAEAFTLLGELGLAEKAMRPCSGLSGGESQRVCLARAFFAKPRLFLADEPASSLDPHIATEMMEALKTACQSSGAAMLFATHHLDHALAYGQRILALKAGQLVLDTPVSGVDRESLRGIYG